MSEIMLQKSISSSSLVKQAAASVQAQQHVAESCSHRIMPGHPNILARSNSDYVVMGFSRATSRLNTSALTSITSSGIQSPTTERKHIHFNEQVEQCIAVDIKDGEEDDDDEYNHMMNDDSDSSDEGLVMMKRSSRLRPIHRNRRTTGFNVNSESKTIAMLPSTTLKYREETPEPESATHHNVMAFWSSKLSSSPSQETLRPSKSPPNALLVEDDEDADMSWNPSGAFSTYGDGISSTHDDGSNSSGSTGTDEDEEHRGLRRTPSGMFMPYEEDEDEAIAAGLFGKVVDTVNTAKDIAHVIWNVGWRR
jgi:hypothetical protein